MSSAPSRGHDLPVGAAGQDAAVELRAGDGSAEQVHDAAMAERRGPEIEDVRDFAVNVKNRRARDDIHAFSHAPMRLGDVVSSGRVEYESGPTKKSRRDERAGQAWSASRLPERCFSARSPSTASTISSPIRARIFRRSSRRSAARAAATRRCRVPVLVPHENLAVAMAHGAYIMTGRPQAVMVHVNVGTGNTLNNLINLSRDRVPLILAAGRTPITEKGRSARARARSTGARRCSTRPAWSARW